MPTKAEREELLDNCIWSWTTQNGVNGYKVTSKTNGNSIFLPAAGCRYGAELNGRGVYGDYWSRSSDTGGNYFQYAYALDYFGGIPGMSFCYRSKGLCVRPVSK